MASPAERYAAARRRTEEARTELAQFVALDALPDLVDADTIVLGDIGSHNQWTRLVLQTLNRTTFTPEGYWGAMGFGLPAALAAKLHG